MRLAGERIAARKDAATWLARAATVRLKRDWSA